MENHEFICDICKKKFNSLNSLKVHVGHHVRKGEVDTAKGLCQNKTNKPSISYNDKGEKVYACKCGRVFTNKQSYVSHCSHCETHLGYKPKRRGSNIQDWWKKLKEEDPDKFRELHSKAGKCSVEFSIRKYGESTLSIFSRTPSEDRDKAHKKQSETRKRLILEGSLDIPKGSHRSYGSYFNGIFLRSTYEAIYVVYLEYYNISWKYESERIYYNRKIWISDFKINKSNQIIEIKGIVSEGLNVYKAFSENGYYISCLGPKEIGIIRNHLRSKGIEIDNLVDKIISTKKLSGKYLNWSFKNLSIIYK